MYTNKEISFFVKAYTLTNPMDETTAPVLDTALATFQRTMEVMKSIKTRMSGLSKTGFIPHLKHSLMLALNSLLGPTHQPQDGCPVRPHSPDLNPPDFPCAAMS